MKLKDLGLTKQDIKDKVSKPEGCCSRQRSGR